MLGLSKLFHSKTGALALTGALMTSSMVAFADTASPGTADPSIKQTVTVKVDRDVPSNAALYELQKKRTVRLTGGVDRSKVTTLIQELRMLDDDPDHGDITLIVNSQGGSVNQGLAVYDVMRSLTSKVNAVSEGESSSMGAFLLIMATGTRSAMPHSYILLHELSIELAGKITEVDRHTSNAKSRQEQMDSLIAESSGLPLDRVKLILKLDFIISAQDAVKSGLIDFVQVPVQPARKAAPHALSEAIVRKLQTLE